MGLSSTLIYTSELILCFTIHVEKTSDYLSCISSDTDGVEVTLEPGQAIINNYSPKWR